MWNLWSDVSGGKGKGQKAGGGGHVKILLGERICSQLFLEEGEGRRRSGVERERRRCTFDSPSNAFLLWKGRKVACLEGGGGEKVKYC